MSASEITWPIACVVVSLAGFATLLVLLLVLVRQLPDEIEVERRNDP